ncbi:hypothetical protein BLL42_05050 [Pseudomonas frederiksbergensis]|uniref:Zinc ribbon domain-containing protein n=1 Tax=Pseudomonas frederiksbergensis TaxID=104087 RepID=A0A1J0EGS6_9PSED|nr:zinc ribbon domain-containing protein [Pseudomonas frederiksbergensis]APC15115.1 hypothetical protein BLL42_05050 [Pseudomonas frederiksbergensis]
MGMIACKECKHQISTTAKTCPSCGAESPTGDRGKQISGLIYLGLIGYAFYWVWGLLTPKVDDVTVPVSAPTSYTITQDESRAPVKRTVEVELVSRVNEADLALVAKEIFAQGKNKTDRTFIGYRVDGKTKGTYWATSHYDPDLKVVIRGLTLADFQTLQAFDVAKAYPQATGAWIRDDGFGYLMVVYECNGKFFIDSIFPNGEKNTNAVVSKRMPDGGLRLSEPDNSFGEFYVVDAEGGLQGWSENGVYMTLQPLQSML